MTTDLVSAPIVIADYPLIDANQEKSATNPICFGERKAKVGSMQIEIVLRHLILVVVIFS